MASTPDHIFSTFSAYFGTTINSVSDGPDTPGHACREPSESREGSPDRFVPLLIVSDIDLGDYREQQALAAAGSTAAQGSAVSHPSPHDFSLSQGNSASDNGDGEDMTEEEFFAQFGEGVPELALPSPSPDSQAQVTASAGPAELDLEAQLELELGPGGGDESIGLTEEDLQAQLDAELATGDNDSSLEICEDDLEAQLNAELEAEHSQEDSAEAARRKANLEEALRIAAEKAALVDSYRRTEDPSPSTGQGVPAEPGAGDVDMEKLLNDKFAELSRLEAQVNKITVKRYSAPELPVKRARLTPRSRPEARVASSQAPPMRRTDELPQMYHHGEINWNLLMKHMNLNTRTELSHCYRSLGLDAGRGKAVYDSLKTYLRTPGNSVDLSTKDVDSDGAKGIVAGIAHRLLVDQRWGEAYFQRPSLVSECKQITFEGDATEVFLEFTSLVYKAMKLEEKRKKGKAKQQEEQAARDVALHPTSEAFATATYCSPQTAARPQAQPSQHVPPASTAQADHPTPVAPAHHQQPRRQVSAITANVTAISPPRGVPRRPPPPPQQQRQQAPTTTPLAANQYPVRCVTQPPPTRQAFIAGMIVAPRSIAPARPS